MVYMYIHQQLAGLTLVESKKPGNKDMHGGSCLDLIDKIEVGPPEKGSPVKAAPV
jgi:hypothetical protein